MPPQHAGWLPWLDRIFSPARPPTTTQAGARPGDDGLAAWRHILHTRPPTLDTRQRELLRHPVRNAIHGLLQERRGASLTELDRCVGTGWGNLHHHLDTLEAKKMIHSHRFGGARLYFPRGVSEEKAALWAVLHRPRARQFLEAVLDRPGVQQKDLLEAIGMSRKVLRDHVALLQEAGLLEERRGPRCTYHPTKRLQRLLPTKARKEPMAP